MVFNLYFLFKFFSIPYGLNYFFQIIANGILLHIWILKYVFVGFFFIYVVFYITNMEYLENNTFNNIIKNKNMS
jgi:hypothetical protein